MKEEAKAKATEIFNSHYFVIFTSETECSEECIVSILAQKAALVTVRNTIETLEHLMVVNTKNEKAMELLNFYDEVEKEIHKL